MLRAYGGVGGSDGDGSVVVLGVVTGASVIQKFSAVDGAVLDGARVGINDCPKIAVGLAVGASVSTTILVTVIDDGNLFSLKSFTI